MIGGVGFPRAVGAALTATGDFQAAYPAGNVLDPSQPRRVALATASGARTFTLTFPAATAVQIVSLIHHNLPEGTLVTVGAWTSLPADETNPAGKVEERTVAVPARISDLAQTLPVILAEPRAVRAVVVTVPAMGAALELGGIDVASWWEWPDINVDETRGYNPTTSTVMLAGGVKEASRQWAPRITSGKRGELDLIEIETVLMDFQRLMGRANPFVFVRDKDDPARWSREAFLARNATLPGTEVREGDIGLMGFDLVEHLG